MYNTEMGFCHHAMCMGVHVLFLSPILAFTGSKRFKDNYSLRSVCATLCVPALGKVGRGIDVFKEKRIGVEESACRWPALGGPSGNAHMISGDKVNRQ